jgi:hypothetical protein
VIADSVGNSKKLYSNAVRKISNGGYDELMEVKDAKEDMKFMISEKDGIINELVMVVGGHRSIMTMKISLKSQCPARCLNYLPTSSRETRMKKKSWRPSAT